MAKYTTNEVLVTIQHWTDNPFLHQPDLPIDIFQREMKYLQLESQHSSTALYAALKKKMAEKGQYIVVMNVK